MKKIIKPCFVLLLIAFTSCGVNEKEHNKVISERDSLSQIVDSLIKENDQLKNGEERLMNLINLSIENNDSLKAYEYLNQLKKYHPESLLMRTHKELFLSIETKGTEILKRIEKARKDSITLANINNLGDWIVGDYVNDFDEPTGEKYVVGNFYGYFSNSATAGSELRIKVLANKGYSDGFDISLQFDEYDNGTYEDDIRDLHYAKIVNKEFRKVYTSSYSYTYFKDENGNGYSIEDIFTEEGNYEINYYMERGRKYWFNINTKYINNALIKAGLKKLGD